MDAITYIDGEWLEGNPPLLGARTHATWLSSMIFDGARAFEGVAPDLDLHCQRAIRSCKAFGLIPTMTAIQIYDLAWEGIRKFPKDAELTGNYCTNYEAAIAVRDISSILQNA